jgi:hypothetical protein
MMFISSLSVFRRTSAAVRARALTRRRPRGCRGAPVHTLLVPYADQAEPPAVAPDVTLHPVLVHAKVEVEVRVFCEALELAPTVVFEALVHVLIG